MEGSFSTVKASSLVVSTKERHGVLVDAMYWEHYCQRVEEMDMPSLDEGNFLAGSTGVFVSMIVALVGVWLGTTSPSPYLIALLVALLAASGILTYFFYRQYDTAKEHIQKSGERISREMREVAAAQRLREAEIEGAAEPTNPIAMGLHIIAARYGQANRFADVTERINGWIQDDRLNFIVDNSTMGGDPLPGVGKVLLIRWRFQGIEQSSSYAEGTHVGLP